MSAPSPWPDRLFDHHNRAGLIYLVTPEGRRHQMDASRWHQVSAADHEVLARVEGPVLDVGCGPGRHCGELAARGVDVLGLDPSEAAIRNASHRGAPVHHGSVFGPVPRAGEWRSILLLDGNVGIGGEPVRLLQRCAELLAPVGRVLVETEPPGRTARRGQMRVEVGDDHSEPSQGARRSSPCWFPWATVPAGQLDSLAEAAGFMVTEVWGMAGRWFGELKRLRADEAEALEVSVA